MLVRGWGQASLRRPREPTPAHVRATAAFRSRLAILLFNPLRKSDVENCAFCRSPCAPPPPHPPIPFSRAYHSINIRIDQIGNNQRDPLLTWLLSVANIVPEGCIAAFAINQKGFCAV